MKTTYIAKPNEIERTWYVVDAEGKPLGRLSSEIAKILRGKNKPIFTPHVDTGDHVIVINAEKVALTGRKITTYRELMKKNPEKVIRLAVWGMLPKNTLGRAMLRKLKVYRGPNHEHQAQKPENLELKL